MRLGNIWFEDTTARAAVASRFGGDDASGFPRIALCSRMPDGLTPYFGRRLSGIGQ